MLGGHWTPIFNISADFSVFASGSESLDQQKEDVSTKKIMCLLHVIGW